jgi:hypothetical protein
MVAWREIAEPGIAAQRQGTAPGKSARGKRPVFTWPPFGTLRVPVWVSLLSAYAALEYSGLCI